MDRQIVPILIAYGVGITSVLVVFELTGFTVSQPQGDYHDMPDYQSSFITLTRTPCFGSCPDYSVSIYGNGTALYEGRQFVKTVGNYSYLIPQSNVSKLVDEFYATEFFSMQDNYGSCIDCPTFTASIVIGDNISKSVTYNGFSAPDRLKVLDKRIDELSGTHYFVRCNEGQRAASND